MAIEFSRGFVFEYTLCQSFPLAMNSIRIINEEVFGGWHPSWTPPASKSQDPIEMADQNMNMCIVQAIAMGFAATLPILLMTWKVSSTGRSMAFIKRVLEEEEEFEELARTRPCLSSALAPTTLPVAFLFVPPVAMLLFQAPCHPVDPSRLPTQPRRVPGPNDTLVDPPTIQPPKPGIKSTKELANELRKAWVELEEANREMLKDTQELAQYSGQANKDDKTWEALIARADQTYADRFSPAVDRYRTLKKLFGDLYPGGPVLQRRVAGGAGASDALGGGPPSSGSPL